MHQVHIAWKPNVKIVSTQTQDTDGINFVTGQFY